MEEFKYMLGTWRVTSTCYGGLIYVKVLCRVDTYNYYY